MKIIITSILTIILICVVGCLYLPFCRYNDIEIYGITYNNDEAISKFVEITKLYPNCFFLTKGSSYSNIPLSDSLGNVHNADIEFKWNNKIKVKVDSVEEFIVPQRIYIFPECSSSDILSVPYDKGLIYSCIEIYDARGWALEIRRQKSSLLLGKRRVGFYLMMKGNVYETGRKTPFDY